MLDKDIIRRRLETGITFAEFTYTLIQGYDFLWLYENKGCIMQVAGQDQWGNITAGIDLIRKKTGKEAYGFTMPLITKKDGTKFGKSEGNAIWLDINKTSSYEMYQFFINTEDEMVIDYLKKLTFLSKEEIEEVPQQQIQTEQQKNTIEEEMEKRLENIFSKMEGVGQVEVMVTMKNTTASILAKEEKKEQSSTREGENKTTQTVKEENTVVMSEDSKGNRTPLIIQETMPEVEGIVIVAEGGENPQVAQLLSEASQALLNVPAHKVAVLKMK